MKFLFISNDIALFMQNFRQVTDMNFKIQNWIKFCVWKITNSVTYVAMWLSLSLKEQICIGQIYSKGVQIAGDYMVIIS